MFTQITMLNMLIAIMGDTFEKITEQKPLYATRTRLELLSDYISNIRSNPSQNDIEQKFLFVVEPEEEEEGFEESWQGTVHQLHSLNKKHANLVQKQNIKKFDLLEDEVIEIKASQVSLAGQVSGLARQNEELASSVSDVRDMLEQVLQAVGAKKEETSEE